MRIVTEARRRVVYTRWLKAAILGWTVSCVLVAAQDVGLIPAVSGAADVIKDKDTAWLFAAATCLAIAVIYWLVRKILDTNARHAAQQQEMQERMARQQLAQQEKLFEVWTAQIKAQDKLADSVAGLRDELKGRPCFTGENH